MFTEEPCALSLLGVVQGVWGVKCGAVSCDVEGFCDLWLKEMAGKPCMTAEGLVKPRSTCVRGPVGVAGVNARWPPYPSNFTWGVEGVSIKLWLAACGCDPVGEFSLKTMNVFHVNIH